MDTTASTPNTTPNTRRRLVFPPKTQHQRRDRDIAVAWITAQQPNRVFESANVTATIHKALKAAGFTVSQPNVKLSMNALVREGWAEDLTIGRRTTMFLLKDDVDVPEPVFITAARRRVTHTSNGVEPELEPMVPEHTPVPPTITLKRQRPPLPKQPKHPPLIDDLHQAVIDWWHEDPVAAEQWAGDAWDALR